MGDVNIAIVDKSSRLVVNIVSAPEGWRDVDDGQSAVQLSQPVGIGWSYDGQDFAAPPPVLPTVDELLSAASVYQNSLLASVWTFNVGTADAPVNLTTKLDDRGQASMLQLLVWSGLADPSDTEPYSNVDSTATTITPSQARTLGLAAGRVKASTYAAYNDIASKIKASPPAITSKDQITGYAWPTT